jgi:septal ring factor EnvC (AmiA/AmiB activator)
MAERDGFSTRLRRRAFRFLSGIDPQTLTDEPARLRAEVRESIAAATRPIADWIAEARRHLAALQESVAALQVSAGAVAERQERHASAALDTDARLSTLRADHAALVAAARKIDEQLASTREWIRGAETHLAALQQQASGAASELAAVLAWIRGAEEHLAALQGDHDRLGALSDHHRLVARLTVLEARLADLERADLAIATAISKARMSDSVS